ncbi:hypothetical protein R3P38DRAFT_2808782 [Favolaschia claudopus]|uniref:Uncharacterized protein n=1 Tax=Favolaschia claudopus TaxID=2862362 RepID=A0AAV9ZF21_9AGAR
MDVKETVDQAIQQGNARVSNGNQADVGELAAHSCPLERKGNHGARSQWKHVLECTSQWSTQQYIKKYDSRQSTWSAYNRPRHFHLLLPEAYSSVQGTGQQYMKRLETKPLTGIIRLYAWRENPRALRHSSKAKHYKTLISWQGLGTSASDCWNPEGYPERLAIFPGNYDRNSVKRGLKTVELRATTPSVGRNSVRINYDGEKLTQITGIQCDTRNSSPVGDYNDSAEEYCWNQICPKWPTNHGSLTAKGLTGLVDLLYGLERKPLELERLNGARRVDYHRVNQTSQRSLVSWQGLGVSTSTARQHQTRDVKVGDNPTARTLSFGKEIEEHAIQQGSVRVNNGMQQDVGELAAHSSPLERKGNQGHRSQGRDPSEALPTARVIAMGQSLRHIPWNVEGNPESLATVTGNWAPNSLPKGPQTRGIRGNNDSVGGNRGQHMKNASRI